MLLVWINSAIAVLLAIVAIEGALGLKMMSDAADGIEGTINGHCVQYSPCEVAGDVYTHSR